MSDLSQRLRVLAASHSKDSEVGYRTIFNEAAMALEDNERETAEIGREVIRLSQKIRKLFG